MNKAYYERHTEELTAPIAAAFGVRIYDVDFSKEGSDYSLCVFIDKDGGVTIEDCENVSRALSDVLDAEDYIAESYTLYVSSPGLTRKLTKDRHFEQSIGSEVEIRLFRPVKTAGGSGKELSGILVSFDASEVTIREEGAEEDLVLERKNVAACRLAFTD